MSDDLENELQESYPALSVESLGANAWRVLVPSPRRPHHYVSISVEQLNDGWVLTDSGEIQALANGGAGSLAEILRCAGSDAELEDQLLTVRVEEGDSVTRAVLDLADLVMAAPRIWEARRCLEERAESETRQPSASSLLARETRARLLGAIPAAAAGLVVLDRTLAGLRGESARLPLAVLPPAVKSLPRLVAAFVDMEASEASIRPAKQVATWTFEVTRDLSIPKYLVVRGSDSDVEHFAEFYDELNVAAVRSNDGQQLVEDTRRVVGALGFGPL